MTCGARYSTVHACDLVAGHAGDHVHHVTPGGDVQIVFPHSAVMISPPIIIPGNYGLPCA